MNVSLRHAVLGAGAALCVSCSELPSEAPSASISTVNYWEKWGDAPALEMQRIADLYNSSQTRFTVEHRAMANADLPGELLSAIEAGQPPDVAGIRAAELMRFVRRDALQPLDARLAESALKSHDYIPAVWHSCDAMGQTWGLPLSPATVALFYNRDLFTEAGLNPDHPPRTPAELAEFSRRMTLRGPGGSLTKVGFSPLIPGWWTSHWGVWFGAGLFDYEGRISARAPRIVAAYTFVQQLLEESPPRSIEAFMRSRRYHWLNRYPFYTGRVAMLMQSTSFSRDIQNHAPELNWDAAPFPCASPELGPCTILDCDLLAMPRGAPNPEGAWDFMLFTQRPENLALLNRGLHRFSPRLDASEEFFDSHPNPKIRLFRALADAPGLQTFPRILAGEELERAMHRVFLQLASSEWDVTSLLANAGVWAQRAQDEQIAIWEERRRGGQSP